MSKTEIAAREFAATKIKDRNKQPDNDIFFAAKEGYEKGSEDMKEKAVESYKQSCINLEQGNCRLSHNCDKCTRLIRFIDLLCS